MRFSIFFFFFIPFVVSWSPSSWRDVPRTRFIQKYPNKKHLDDVQDKLKKCAPLVNSYECNDLKRQIHLASVGKAFVLMGGDCAESLENFPSN